MTIEAVLNTEQVNRYGFRILTDGISTENFLKNPVVLLGHDYNRLPVGRVLELKKEAGNLIGKIELDDNEPVAEKFKKGLLNAFSIGIRVLETSDDEKLVLQGQTRSTITKSELLEVSVVTVPGNPGAVRLEFNDSQIVLSADDNKYLDIFLPKIQKDRQMKSDFLSKLAVTLGVSEANEETLLEQVKELKQFKQQTEAEVKEWQDKYITAILTYGKETGAISDDEEKDFKELALINPDLALKQIKKNQRIVSDKEVSLKAVIEKLGRNNGGEKKWSDLSDKEIAQLAVAQPELYRKLFYQEFGIYPEDVKQ